MSPNEKIERLLVDHFATARALGVGLADEGIIDPERMRLTVEARQEKAKELTKPVEQGGLGLSHRKAAKVLGVSKDTVRKDLAPKSPVNGYKVASPPKPLPPGTLGPGAWVEPPKSKPPSTCETRILAAIESGKGLRAAAKEIVEADELAFDDQHLDALIAQMKTEAESRHLVQRALEAHSKRRQN